MELVGVEKLNAVQDRRMFAPDIVLIGSKYSERDSHSRIPAGKSHGTYDAASNVNDKRLWWWHV